MQQLKQTLQDHHNKNQHHTQLRINLYYEDMAQSSNNTLLAKQDIQVLVKRLTSKGYIDGYIWTLAFNSKQGIHAQALFYLNNQQHDALAVIAIEALWKELTHKEGCIIELMHCADNINKLNECKDELKALLDSADKVYTWLLDVFHLLTISQIDIQNQHIDNLLNILKPRNFIDNYPHLCTLLTEQEPNKAFVAIQALVSITHCWKNAIAYCNIDFSACFLDLKSQLIQIEYQTTRLSSDFPNPFYVAHSCLYDLPIISDGWRALVAKGWGNIGRKYNFSYLKKSYQKISAFLFSHQQVLNRANNLFFSLNIPTIDFKSNLRDSLRDIYISLEKQKWNENFDNNEQQLKAALSLFSCVCSKMVVQLELFEKGQFDKPVLAITPKR